MNPGRRAIIKLTEEKVRGLLNLPDEYSIIGVYADPQTFSIDVIVASDNLREIIPGTVPPTIEGRLVPFTYLKWIRQS